MKIIDITQKIVLGTAQFSMDYGITNVSGQPTKKEVFNILSLAWGKGVRRFDTAPGYGSEKLLGEFIVAHGLKNEVKVLTKIPSLEGSSNCRQTIQSSLESSLEHLGCPINVLFLHKAADSVLLLEDSNTFENLLNENPVSTIGVSVYKPEEVKKLSECQFELAFQFPFNILDRRFDSVSMQEGKRYARSIFLQGLLASKNGLRQDAPKALLALHNDYHNRIAENNLNPVQFALSFVANAKNLDYFIVGVDTVGQFHDVLNFNLYDHKQMNVVDIFRLSIDNKWLDPRAWN